MPLYLRLVIYLVEVTEVGQTSVPAAGRIPACNHSYQASFHSIQRNLVLIIDLAKVVIW